MDSPVEKMPKALRFRPGIRLACCWESKYMEKCVKGRVGFLGFSSHNVDMMGEGQPLLEQTNNLPQFSSGHLSNGFETGTSHAGSLH